MAGDGGASHNCRLNCELWLKLGLEFGPNPGLKRAEESDDYWIQEVHGVKLQTDPGRGK